MGEIGCGVVVLAVFIVISRAFILAFMTIAFGCDAGDIPQSIEIASTIIAIAFWILALFISARKETKREQALMSSDPSQLSPSGFEEFTSIWLRNSGFREVEIVGKTGDYGADVIAKDRSGHMMAVQCKRYRGSTGIRSVQEVFSAKSYYGCGRSAVFTTGHFTRQARELAEKNGVELYCWDGRSFEREN